jgi:hypothetical protein
MTISFSLSIPSQKMFLNKQAEVKYSQSNLKRRPTKTNIFYALSLPSAGSRAVDFSLSLLTYMLLLIRSSPTEIPGKALTRTIFNAY